MLLYEIFTHVLNLNRQLGKNEMWDKLLINGFYKPAVHASFNSIHKVDL